MIGPRRALAVPVVLAGLSMLGPFSIDTPFPAFTDLQAQFDVGAETTQQVVSAYLLAFAAMSILHGPLSDAVGRRPVMLVSLSAYAVASVGAALAPSMTVLLVCRVLQGLSAGGGVIVSRTIIRDLYAGAEAQRLMSRVMMIFGLAPAVAPVIGGWLLQVTSWRGIFGFLAVLALLLVATVVVVLPETHPPERRTRLSVVSIVTSLLGVVRSGRFQRVAWAATFLFAAYFLYVGSAAIVVVDLLHQGPRDFWVLFVPLIAGFIAGSAISGRLAGRVDETRLVSAGTLVSIGAGAINVAVVAVAPTLPWAVVGLSFPTLQLVVLDMFPRSRGAAASAVTGMTLVVNAIGAGALAPLVTSSLLVLAVTAFWSILAGGLMWGWHLRRGG